MSSLFYHVFHHVFFKDNGIHTFSIRQTAAGDVMKSIL